MNKKFFLSLTALLFATVCFMLPKATFAESSTAADPLGFTVEAIQSSTQIDKDKSYFYLKTQPGVEQKVQVKVTGTSATPVKVKAYVSNAITSEAGTINYIPDSKKDKTLTNSIEEIAVVDNPEFEIADKEEKIVTITIKTPKESYDGIKLGAVYFKRIDSDDEKQTSQITSEYSYRIGICLSESEKVYNDGQSLNLTKATPELVRLQKTISLTFQNPEPKMIIDLNMNIKIIDNKSGKVVKKQELVDGTMAPNSTFNYAVDWGIETIPTGKYTAKVEATSKHKSWTLEKEFEITSEQAKKMNQETLYKLFLPNWAYTVTILLGVATLGFSLLFSLRNKKWLRIKNKRRRKRKTKKQL